ncbi:hypothetical protein AVEN_100567-2-1, partial [Araneus ventricosus]
RESVAKSSIANPLLRKDIRHCAIPLNDASRHGREKGRREGSIVESDECINKGDVVHLEMNGETLCHCEMDNDALCVCARVGIIDSSLSEDATTNSVHNRNECLFLNSRNVSTKMLPCCMGEHADVGGLVTGHGMFQLDQCPFLRLTRAILGRIILNDGERHSRRHLPLQTSTPQQQFLTFD